MSASISTLADVQRALAQLDEVPIRLNGKMLRSSQCYHFENDPFHLLFNTNCPDLLKETVTRIIEKYHPIDK